MEEPCLWGIFTSADVLEVSTCSNFERTELLKRKFRQLVDDFYVNSVNQLTIFTFFAFQMGNGQLTALEFKWGGKQPSVPKAFKDAYPHATYQVVNPNNYLEYIL